MSNLLGLDASTQSVSAIVLDPQGMEVLAEASVSFGADLPHWDAPQGFLKSTERGVVHADPCMWLEGLDLCLERLQTSGVDFKTIAAVSGAGQQHGTVYLNARGMLALSDFAKAPSLAKAFEGAFSRATSPIWMDSSTTSQCHEIEAALGGPLEVCRRSGSVAIERFSGPQIRRFWQTEPDNYRATQRIHLVSSFLASVLAGTEAPIDFGDGAGMNLLNLAQLDWDSELMAATAPDLASRLPKAVASSTWTGTIASYFQNRYGFSDSTKVLTFTGDNPSSLVGSGGADKGRVIISLGTSDTLFAAMSEAQTDPEGCGHVFANPLGGYMTLQCFANGSLARETVKDALGYSWDAFSSAVEATPAACGGKRLLPFFVPEISPRRPQGGVRSRGFMEGNWEKDPAAARACLEGQFINMKRAAAWMALEPEVIYLTGGASRNDSIAQVVADVFATPVRRMEVSGSVALGAAMRAGLAAELLTGPDLDAFFQRTLQGTAIVPSPKCSELYATIGPDIEALLET
jgi:xylulokinase